MNNIQVGYKTVLALRHVSQIHSSTSFNFIVEERMPSNSISSSNYSRGTVKSEKVITEVLIRGAVVEKRA